MSNFDKTQYKPIIYQVEICKLLGIPHKPHYKCYIIKKYSRLNYTQKRQIHTYISNYIKDNNIDEFVNRYYNFPHWKLGVLLQYFQEEDSHKINKIKNNLLTMKYSNDQIYLKLETDNSKPIFL